MPTELLESPGAAPPAPAARPAPVNADVAGQRAARVEIKASDMTPAQILSNEPRPGSARAAMSESLKKIAKNTDGTKPTESTEQIAKVPGAVEGNQPAQPGEEGEKAVGEQSDPNAEKVAPKPGETVDPAKAKKANPWRLVDDYKGRLAAAEAKLAEFSKTNATPEAVKTVTDQLAKATARLKELEGEMVHTNYTKTEHFQKEYQEPYEDAWKRSMSELNELTVDDGSGTGNQRAFTAQDMLELVNLPLPKAHALAEEKFGSLATEVMSHRMEIKRLFDKQAKAIAEAKTKGEEFFKQQSATNELRQKEANNFTQQTWVKENEALLKHPTHSKHFTPIEGDDVGNAKLEKGFKFADDAMAGNINDPSLTPEQRAEIVKKHASLRYRAAAYGRHVHQLEQKDARIAELESQLKQFESSTPNTQGREEAPAGAAPAGSAMEQAKAALRARAR